MKPLVIIALLGVLPVAAQTPELVLKSTSRVVQLEVFVNDASGRPVHGLKKNDFALTDNGQPRDIQIFSGEVDANDSGSQPELASSPPGVYSNRFGLHDARIVTALVIDAVLRPEGLQRETRIFVNLPPQADLKRALGEARGALNQMAPGEVMGIYVACPDLRVVQDFTSDPEQLRASLESFTAPCALKSARTVEALVPPMLSALRDVAARMASASGRKSVVWISQAYGSELKAATIQGATDAAILAFNDANVPLYAVDTRFNPICDVPSAAQGAQAGVVSRSCRTEPDASDLWMDSVARATGGRSFSGGIASGYEMHDAQGRFTYGYTQMERSEPVSDALLYALDDSRYAYEMGFYVQDSELDGKVHMLGVKTPAKPKLGLRYRSSYTASEEAMAPAPEATKQNIDPPKIDLQSVKQVGIDASVAKARAELRVSLALDPATVSIAGDHIGLLDVTFTETDYSGRQLAKVQETVSAPLASSPQEMIRFTRAVALAKGAALLRVTIRDQGTNRVGTLAIPVGRL